MAGGETTHGLRASLHRVRVVATVTVREALRLRLALLLLAAGAGLVFVALGLREFNFGAAELKFIADFGLGAIGLLGSLLAALAMAQLYFDDLANGIAACVLARAVRRWEYLAGKFLGVAALLALYVAALSVVLAVIIGVREAQLGAVLAPLAVFLQCCALVWLKVTLVAALTLLVCSYAGSALFASSAGLMLAVIGHLRSYAGSEDWLGLLRFWPNLALFDAGPLLASGQGLSLVALAAVAGYWALYVVLLTALASYVFKHREL
jgi:ABC-type transport system involved in multi-copper enzyme maturation permease subunit